MRFRDRRKPEPEPVSVAQVDHAPKGSIPRYVRRHATQMFGDLTRRRNRKARARLARLVSKKGTLRGGRDAKAQ